MKKIISCKDRMEAQIIKAKLEAYGIEAFIQSDDEGGLHPGMSMTQGVFILVADENEREAKAILENNSDESIS